MGCVVALEMGAEDSDGDDEGDAVEGGLAEEGRSTSMLLEEEVRRPGNVLGAGDSNTRPFMFCWV